MYAIRSYYGEVHIWSNRPLWPQGMQRPEGKDEVPSTFDWDLWLGPAAERPYAPEYVPFHWRRYWAFGGGRMADMVV